MPTNHDVVARARDQLLKREKRKWWGGGKVVQVIYHKRGAVHGEKD